jgi:dipeptidyl-peptidase-3
MFQAIRKACPEIFEVRLDAPTRTLIVRVNRSLIESAGQPALGDLLLRLHIYRCTADVTRCRTLMDELTEPSPESLEWRRILLDAKAGTRVFVQLNTFLDGADAVLKDCEHSAQGMVQSWAERQV